MSGSNILTIPSKERRIVNAEEHTHCRLIYGNRRKRLRILIICNGISNLKPLNAHNCTDITAFHALRLALLNAGEDHKVFNALFYKRSVSVAKSNILACLKNSPLHSSHCNSANVRRVFQRGDKHLRRALKVLLRTRNLTDNQIHQRSEVCGWLLPVQTHPALLCTAVNGLEV